MRVVSLVPSVTETLLAWGVTPIAVTRFCEQPDLPTVGGTKNPDIDAIVALAPDLVVVDEEENRRPDADALVAAGIEVHATAVRSLDDVAPQLDRLAERLGIAGSRSAWSVPPVTGDERVRVFVPIWRRPWMTVSHDTYGASLLSALAADTVLSDPSQRYPEVTLDAVRDARPRLTLLPTEPYAFGGTHVAELEHELGCPAFVVDGKDLFWWGVRTGDALARLGSHLEAMRG